MISDAAAMLLDYYFRCAMFFMFAFALMPMPLRHAAAAMLLSRLPPVDYAAFADDAAATTGFRHTILLCRRAAPLFHFSACRHC